MNWKDIASIVGKAAPVIGTLLGGPAGTAVGALVAGALGTDNTPDAVSAALAGNPDALVKVQELQTNAHVQLQQLVVTAEQNRLHAANQQYAAEAADRDSARKLAAQQSRDWMRPTLSLAIVASTIAIVFLVITGVANGALSDKTSALEAGGVVMYFIRESAQILGFWFGMAKDAATSPERLRVSSSGSS